MELEPRGSNEPYIIRHSESPFTNRLYIADGKLIKAGADMKGKEGLGMTEYRGILGPIFSLIGVAFKTQDDKGNNIYINKNSFINYLSRKAEHPDDADDIHYRYVVQRGGNVKGGLGKLEAPTFLKAIKKVFDTAIPPPNTDIKKLEEDFISMAKTGEMMDEYLNDNVINILNLEDSESEHVVGDWEPVELENLQQDPHEDLINHVNTEYPTYYRGETNFKELEGKQGLHIFKDTDNKNQLTCIEVKYYMDKKTRATVIKAENAVEIKKHEDLAQVSKLVSDFKDKKAQQKAQRKATSKPQPKEKTFFRPENNIITTRGEKPDINYQPPEDSPPPFLPSGTSGDNSPVTEHRPEGLPDDLPPTLAVGLENEFGANYLGAKSLGEVEAEPAGCYVFEDTNNNNKLTYIEVVRAGKSTYSENEMAIQTDQDFGKVRNLMAKFNKNQAKKEI